MIRGPRDDDVDAIVTVIRECGVHDCGPAGAEAAESVRSDLLGSWNRPRFQRATDAWVVEEEDRVVGYADVHVRVSGEAVSGGYILPAFRGRGLGSALLDRVEARTDGAARLTVITSGHDRSADELFESRGYERGETTWQMTIDLHEPPPEPEWPPGVTVRPIDPEQDVPTLFDVIETANRDAAPDRRPIPYDEWVAVMFREDTDPSLYFIAERGGEPVGAVLCPWYPDIGWIRQLGVRADQRRQGIGLALVYHAFGALYARGHRRIGLGVEDWNWTNPRRLYERAGMRATLEHRRYHR